jgi:hypothetical protein
MTKIYADFWVIASSVMTIDFMYERFNSKPNTTVLYADTADVSEKDYADRMLSVNYIPYDQRHFGGMNCTDLISSELSLLGGYDPANKCCKHIIQGRKTIQERLMNFTGYERHYGTGDSVAVHMLALAVLLGLNPIYICGVDLDYSKGYVDEKTTNPDSFDPWLDRLGSDFSIINESAKNIGVKIINLSSESMLKNIMETKTQL